MSDDGEMTDLSQVPTESGSLGQTPLSFPTSQTELGPEPWAAMVIYRIYRKRLGVRVLNYSTEEVRRFELVKNETSFGRKGDCNISDLIVGDDKRKEISSNHFRVLKNNVEDTRCPVFLEDSSQNGTYYRPHKPNTAAMQDNVRIRVDKVSKRRILAQKDFIFIEKHPTICFEFRPYQTLTNGLPADINADYHIGKELGSGACGTVYFAQNRTTCQPYALKFTNSKNNENATQTMLKEVKILLRLKHPCVLQFFNKRTYLDSVAIFIDYMEGGDLLTRIQKYGYFSESLTKFMAYQICCGIEYLHSQNVTHRDLKPENILLATADKYTLVKVSDFGLSKFIDGNSELRTQCGTRMYAAPEVRQGVYTDAVDIWSFGVILFNCFTGRYPFHGNHYTLQFDDDQWSDVSKDAQNIVRETLRVKAAERPSAKILLTQRNWLNKTDKSVQRASEIISEQEKKCKSTQ